MPWIAALVFLTVLLPVAGRAQDPCADDVAKMGAEKYQIATAIFWRVTRGIDRTMLGGSGTTSCPQTWDWTETRDPDEVDRPWMAVRIITVSGNVSYMDAAGFRRAGRFAARALVGWNLPFPQVISVAYDW